MTIIEALDTVFSFIPPILLDRLKKEGFYSPILEKKAKNAAEFYDYMDNRHIDLQTADYSALANEFKKVLLPGSILQIGCGQGDLLFRLAGFRTDKMIGLDRSQLMLDRAKIKNAPFSNVEFILGKAESFDYSHLGIINNIIIQNFWGILDIADSCLLLNKLRTCLDENGQIIIGEYREDLENPKLKTAYEVLTEKLGFTFAYPFYKDFSACGYQEKIIHLNGLKYFQLKQN